MPKLKKQRSAPASKPSTAPAVRGAPSLLLGVNAAASPALSRAFITGELSIGQDDDYDMKRPARSSRSASTTSLSPSLLFSPEEPSASSTLRQRLNSDTSRRSESIKGSEQSRKLRKERPRSTQMFASTSTSTIEYQDDPLNEEREVESDAGSKAVPGTMDQHEIALSTYQARIAAQPAQYSLPPPEPKRSRSVIVSNLAMASSLILLPFRLAIFFPVTVPLALARTALSIVKSNGGVVEVKGGRRSRSSSGQGTTTMSETDEESMQSDQAIVNAGMLEKAIDTALGTVLVSACVVVVGVEMVYKTLRGDR